MNSNTWVLLDETSREAWLVDCGDMSDIIKLGYNVKGVLVTHSHFDHIYGLNEAVSHYPELKVYCSAHAKNGLYSSKLNCSRYHEKDFEYTGGNVVVVEDGDHIPLFNGINAEVLATPGHDAGCFSFIVEDYIFTGDSYIPGYRVLTTLRGNKVESENSVNLIMKLISERHLTMCPGHEEIVPLG